VPVDLILVGGGLANSLIAWRLRMLRPELDVRLLEKGATLGGNHTWSFHSSDLTPPQRQWIEPLIEHSWRGHEVRFPELRRRLSGGYHSFTSRRLHVLLSDGLGERAVLGVDASIDSDRQVTIPGGECLAARAVIDGRGGRGPLQWAVAYQKFLGLSVTLEKDHGLEMPILMDATVEQRDGFRFIYTLPLSPRQLLVEDTRYSDTAVVAAEEMRAEIRQYAADSGWNIASIEREEVGVLPIVLEGNVEALWADSPSKVPRAGVRAGLFHPTTGYSLPDAVRLADDIATSASLDAADLYEHIRSHAVRHWRQRRFYRLLNRMLFRAARPDQRYRVLERFYRLPSDLIDRFYAGELGLLDRIRLLTGKPPVPVWKALGCLRENGAAVGSDVGGSTLTGPK
jgi:lycopene beta-cyclase